MSLYIFTNYSPTIMNTDAMRDICVMQTTQGSHSSYYVCADFLGDRSPSYLARCETKQEAASWLARIYKALEEGQHAFCMIDTLEEDDDGQNETG